MKPFAIITDSSCDVEDAYLAKRNIRRVPFYVSFDMEHYEKEIEELSLSDFYDTLTAKPIFPKTSMPSVDDYMNAFHEAIDSGMDILCICITPKFSGSYQSAQTAREIVLEKNTDAKIHIINSMQATGAQGMTVIAACDLRDAGRSIEETAERLLSLTSTSRIMFTVGTLEYLERGGRIGKVASLAGTLLKLQPLIELKDGELTPYGTIRGRKKALSRIVEMTSEHFAREHLSYDDYLFGVITGHSARDEALLVKNDVEKLIGRPIDLPLFPVGVTIGTYTGPDPVGICFIEKP